MRDLEKRKNDIESRLDAINEEVDSIITELSEEIVAGEPKIESYCHGMGMWSFERVEKHSCGIGHEHIILGSCINYYVRGLTATTKRRLIALNDFIDFASEHLRGY